MSNEQLAALLEVVSFFFVGIDLYGPERLGKAQNRMLVASEYVHDQVNRIQNFEWKKDRSSRFMMIIHIVSIGIEIIVITFIVVRAVNNDGNGSSNSEDDAWIGIMVGAIFGIVLGYIVIFSMVLISIFFIVLGLIAFTESTIFFLKAFIKIMKSYHMEGVFLFIGTALFLISKYVQFYY